MNMKYKLFLVCSVAFLSCFSSRKKAFLEFIEKNSTTSFRVFDGLSVFQRGIDDDQNIKVYLRFATPLKYNGELFIVWVSRSDSAFWDNSTDLAILAPHEEKQLLTAAVKFKQLGIHSIGIDEYDNVSLSLRTNSYADLIWLSKKGPDFFEDAGMLRKEWVSIGDGWFYRKYRIR